MPYFARAAYLEHLAVLGGLAGIRTLKPYAGELRQAAEDAAAGKPIKLVQLMPALLVLHVDTPQRGYDARHQLDALVLARDQALRRDVAEGEALRLATQLRRWLTANPGFAGDDRDYTLIGSEADVAQLGVQHLFTLPAFACYVVSAVFDEV